MLLKTLVAFRDHGHVERTVDKDIAAAHQVISRFEATGFSLAAVTTQVLNEGIEKFDHSLDKLLKLIDARRGK